VSIQIGDAGEVFLIPTALLHEPSDFGGQEGIWVRTCGIHGSDPINRSRFA
jgi:hypothetical protein